MYGALIEYVKSVKLEDIHMIDLEEIALLEALRASYPPNSPEAMEFAFVPGLLQRWLRLDFEALTPAFYMRMQPLLRSVLTALISDGAESLPPSHVQYLIAVSTILERVRGTEKNNRLLKLFREHNETLQDILSGNEVGGLPDLHSSLRLTNANEILNSPRRKTTTFGGIDLPLTGPMMSHTGDIKVLDSVPDDTMLTVEGGSCYVSGFVMGHVSTTDRCEVRENISGTVIAGKGSIKARNVLNKAYVISKWSDVIIENAEDPDLIFAGGTLHIHGNAISGNYVAPIIKVEGSVAGGELSFSESCIAAKFLSPPNRKLILEFQNKISCDVYGGLVDPAAGRALASINRTKNRHEHITKMVKALHTECEHFASNGIMYLLGGDIFQAQIEEIARKQRRIAFLERIINGIDGLARTARMRLIQQQQRTRGGTENTGGKEGLEEVNDDLAQMKANADLDSDLATEGHELSQLTSSITGRDPIESSAIVTLDRKKLKWIAERIVVSRDVTALEKLIERSLAHDDLNNPTADAMSKVQLFTHLMRRTKERSSTDPILRRSRSNFVQIVAWSIEQRKHRMMTYGRQLKRLSEEHAQLCENLKSTYNLEPPTEQDDESSPFAAGIFDRNVLLCTDKYLTDSPQTEHDGLHFTTLSSAPRAYKVRDGGITEIPMKSR